MLAEAQESSQILDEEKLAFLADPGILDGQAAQTTIPNTNAFQTKDLDGYDSDCDGVSNAKAVLMANLSNYGSDVILEVPYSEPYHHDMDNQSVHAMQDFEQTPVFILQIIRDIDFGRNLGKYFVPQQELSAEQAFCLQTSNPNTDQYASSPVKIKAPKELPKVSLVNTSLKKLKYHLGQFNTVVKKRITPDAITEGEWGFDHTKAIFLNEIILFLKTLKDIFNVFDKDLLNKSFDEGPFKMGKFRETLAEGALHLGPERDRVVTDLTPKEKERYKSDIRAMIILLQDLPKDIYILINHYTDAKEIWDNVKMLLEGSELMKDECESQLYDDFEHFCQNKSETIHVYYIRFTKLINDMRNIMLGYSKHMTKNIKLLIYFVWKFLGTVRFCNDHIAAILGYGDLKWGNINITRVYFVK
nr:integrase, catalytic region, zinc finger, CCHC-type, peptidase aspartic, catalytic [Tanacetum cinerariifolium]